MPVTKKIKRMEVAGGIADLRQQLAVVLGVGSPVDVNARVLESRSVGRVGDGVVYLYFPSTRQEFRVRVEELDLRTCRRL